MPHSRQDLIPETGIIKTGTVELTAPMKTRPTREQSATTGLDLFTGTGCMIAVGQMHITEPSGISPDTVQLMDMDISISGRLILQVAIRHKETPIITDAD